MINDHRARRPLERTTLDPHDILILDAVVTLESTNPAAAGTVLKGLMRDFWSGRVKLYRLRRPDDTYYAHYEWSADDVRQYSDEDDDVGSRTPSRIYAPFDRDYLFAGLRYLFDQGLVGGFGSEFDSLPKHEVWAHAAACNPNDYDPDRVFLGLLRIRLEELLTWASRMSLSRPHPWPTKGELNDQFTEYKTRKPGRPTSINLVREELQRRNEKGQTWPSYIEAGRELEAWLRETHPTEPTLKAKRISDVLKDEIRIA